MPRDWSAAVAEWNTMAETQLLMKDEKEIKISVYNGNTYVGDTYVDDAYYVANTLLTIPL